VKRRGIASVLYSKLLLTHHSVWITALTPIMLATHWPTVANVSWNTVTRVFTLCIHENEVSFYCCYI